MENNDINQMEQSELSKFIDKATKLLNKNVQGQDSLLNQLKDFKNQLQLQLNRLNVCFFVYPCAKHFTQVVLLKRQL